MDTWNKNARMQRELDTVADTGSAIGADELPDIRFPNLSSGPVLKGNKNGSKTVPVPVSKPVSRSQDA